jgi:hypothetical protein
MKRSRATQVAPCLTLALVTGCCLFTQGIKTFQDMTPKEKALWLMSVYNKEYVEYEAATQDPTSLTEDQKETLRLKKKALQTAWPLIRAYTSMVNSGVASEETERNALKAVEALLGIGGDPNA